MQKALQLAAGAVAMFLLAPVIYGTPLYHWTVLVPVFVLGMWLTAQVQHWFHWRASNCGRAARAPGTKANGRL